MSEFYDEYSSGWSDDDSTDEFSDNQVTNDWERTSVPVTPQPHDYNTRENRFYLILFVLMVISAVLFKVFS